MAEERILQKKFGNSGGTTEFGSFGSLAEGAAVTTKDLDTIQALDTFLRGWYGATGGGSEPPRLEDMNGLFFLLFSQIRYILESGIPEWLNDSGQRYYENRSIITYNGNIYIAIQGDDSGAINTQRNPSTETDWWRLLISVQGAVNLIGAQTVEGIKTFSSIPVLPSSNPTSNNQATRKAYVDGLTDTLQTAVNSLNNDKAENTITISASNGLTGGGNLTANRTISGVNASTGAKGVVQLNNTRTSTSTSQAATANVVKENKDAIDDLDGEVAKTGESNTFTGGNTFSGETTIYDMSLRAINKSTYEIEQTPFSFSIADDKGDVYSLLATQIGISGFAKILGKWNNLVGTETCLEGIAKNSDGSIITLYGYDAGEIPGVDAPRSIATFTSGSTESVPYPFSGIMYS